MVLKYGGVNGRRWDLSVGRGLGSPWERLARALAIAHERCCEEYGRDDYSIVVEYLFINHGVYQRKSQSEAGCPGGGGGGWCTKRLLIG